MNRNISSIITVVLTLSMVLTVGFSINAMAEPAQNDPSSGSSETSTVTSAVSSESSNISSDASSSEESSSDEDSSANDVSSQGSESSEATSSEEEDNDTVSSKTSSTSSTKPSTSAGRPNGNTFINEYGSAVTIPDEDLNQDGTEDEYVDEEEIIDEEEHFYIDDNVRKMGSVIAKVIWIPILFAVLAIAGLVYVNVFYPRQFKQSEKNSRKELFGVKNQKKKAIRHKPTKSYRNRKR